MIAPHNLVNVNSISRREALRLAALGAGALALAACGAGAPAATPAGSAASAAASAKPATSASGVAKALTPVKIGYAAQSGNSVPVFVGADAGLYARYGLQAEPILIAGSPNTIRALVANEVQIAIVGAAASVQAALGGADVVLVSTLAPGLAYRIYSLPDIGSLQDLKGKRMVESIRGTDPDFAIQLVLKKNGMQYSDLQYVNVQEGGDPARLGAMQASKAESVILAPGSFTVAEQQFKLKLLLDLIEEKIPYEAATVAMSRSWVKSHPDEVLAYVRALTASVKFCKDNRPETLRILKKYTRNDDDTVANEMYDYYAGSVFPRELLVSEEGVQTLLDLAAQSNPAAKDRKAAEFIDNSFVKRVTDEGLIKQLYG
jgi:NitT/TauT family transport system substrate-binding protein